MMMMISMLGVRTEEVQVQMKKDGLLLVGDGEPELELFLATLSQAAPALRRLHPPEHHRHDDHQHHRHDDHHQHDDHPIKTHIMFINSSMHSNTAFTFTLYLGMS